MVSGPGLAIDGSPQVLAGFGLRSSVLFSPGAPAYWAPLPGPWNSYRVGTCRRVGCATNRLGLCRPSSRVSRSFSARSHCSVSLGSAIDTRYAVRRSLYSWPNQTPLTSGSHAARSASLQRRRCLDWATRLAATARPRIWDRSGATPNAHICRDDARSVVSKVVRCVPSIASRGLAPTQSALGYRRLVIIETGPMQRLGVEEAAATAASGSSAVGGQTERRRLRANAAIPAVQRMTASTTA
jgi:hypothetical protein